MNAKLTKAATACPNCGATVVNVQGFVTCGNCGWNGGI